MFGRGSYSDGGGRCVEGGHISQKIKGTEGKSEGHDKKQEMARVNVDILGISELKWTAMGEFNSDDHYIYYCG